MNTINYQPTGVYQQFVQNPNLLNQGASLSQANVSPSSQQDLKNSKVKRTLKIGGVVAAAAAAVGLGVYYKKGMNAIKLKEEIFPEVENAEKLKEKIDGRPHNKIERDAFESMYASAQKYSKNLVGKMQKAIKRVHTFFEENFYNY